MAEIERSDDKLIIKGTLTWKEAGPFLKQAGLLIRNYPHHSILVELDELEAFDTAGAGTLHRCRELLEKQKIEVQFSGVSSELANTMEMIAQAEKGRKSAEDKPGFLERIGSSTSYVFREYITSYLTLASEITYWSAADLFKRGARRKGEIANQSVLMGVNAAFIVGLMSFIIGLVLALQSSAQLRMFGANIYIVDLTVIAMMSEMGPLITAIMVAGRSGSSIAAEIATMKVTSETDALTTMGMRPLRFIVVPKLYAGLITMPFLVVIANILGILGGMLIAALNLDISPTVFINRMQESLYLRDIIFGIIKSVVFAYIIVVTGSYFGFRVTKGPAGVGKVTTQAVVVAISLVIVADSIMGMIFYR